MKPSITGLVIVPMNPATNNGADEAPAIITRVWSDTLINVRVFSDTDTGDSVMSRTSLTLHDEKPESPGHDAWWPPRV